MGLDAAHQLSASVLDGIARFTCKWIGHTESLQRRIPSMKFETTGYDSLSLWQSRSFVVYTVRIDPVHLAHVRDDYLP